MHGSSKNLRQPRGRSFLAILLLFAALVQSTNAAYRNWTSHDGNQGLEAELVAFDFAAKEMIVRDRAGGEQRIRASDLDLDGRIQLLLSPKFLQSYPEEDFSAEQVRFILTAIAVPAFFLLLSFYLCAVLLLKKINPLRALIGWFGSVLLGSFLAGFYVTISARSPGAATGIAIFGFLVISGLLSLFISIIYGCTVLKGFKVLMLHFFGAVVLILGAVMLVKYGIDPAETEAFLNDHLFGPVGIIGL